MDAWQQFEPVVIQQTDEFTNIQPVRSIQQTRGYIIVPAFSLTTQLVPWPRMVAQYNFITEKAFAFEDWPIDKISNDWMLCLSWRRGGRGNMSNLGWKVRYQLWEDPKYGFKVYTSDIIHRYFSIEFWKLYGHTVELNNDLKLYTSLRYFNTSFYEVERDISNCSSLVTNNEVISWPASWPLVVSDDVTWLDNQGTWNELTAGSEKSAAELLPASFA